MNYKKLEKFSTWDKEYQDWYSVSVIKGLIMDTVRNANSGHTGGPMSSADFAYILFKYYLKFDPKNENWFNRDRFILSAGHESALVYVLLHLIEWLTLDDLKHFRQLNSKTPGHPEVDIPGVECTTGPLGQGFSMGVGMAVAESFLRNKFKDMSIDTKGLVEHFTYILASDGDMQEPVTLGSAALAGHLGLSKLIVYYDSNMIQISGKVNRADSTNYATVFSGFNWHVQEIDGHDHKSIHSAIQKAHSVRKPSIIIGKTIIAKGSFGMEGNHNTHGAPLPLNEINATKEKLGLSLEPFELPKEVKDNFQLRFNDLHKNVSRWKRHLDNCLENQDINEFWSIAVEDNLPKFNYPKFESGISLATRKAFGMTLDCFALQLPNIIGGSADLEPSNYTGNFAENYSDFQKDNKLGRNIAFGVREFPMAAMMNGMALHGGVIPFGGTFLVFSDYERPALRLAAIQSIRVIHEFTHDSFFVGEDGPTHQPVEHAMALRAIPEFYVFRPGDAKETAFCFAKALQLKKSPSALLLTRQGVPVSEKSFDKLKSGIDKGGYIYKDCKNKPDLVLIATGSELSLAVETSKRMTDKSIRIVSLPCWELFFEQSIEYRSHVIPDRGCMKISIEAGITFGWERIVGPAGLSIGLDRYGASAPNKDLAEKFGFTPEKVENKIRKHLKQLL
tara:strand:- start:15559 stop:17583 length:2025 start_codon:yes stop_codon:yes gene_type:complete